MSKWLAFSSEALIGIFILAANPVAAASNFDSELCFLFRSEILASRNPVDFYPTENEKYIHCAVDLLGDQYDSLNLEQRVALTGSVRKILLQSGTAAIFSFRGLDNETVIANLSSGVRSPHAPLRVNSSIILASVADNTTICYIIDAAYAVIDATSEPDLSARINFLGIFSNVSPWSYRENYNYIVEYINTVISISSNNPELTATASAAKFALKWSEVSTSYDRNKSTPLPSNIDNCRLYNYKHR